MFIWFHILCASVCVWRQVIFANKGFYFQSTKHEHPTITMERIWLHLYKTNCISVSLKMYVWIPMHSIFFQTYYDGLLRIKIYIQNAVICQEATNFQSPFINSVLKLWILVKENRVQKPMMQFDWCLTPTLVVFQLHRRVQ